MTGADILKSFNVKCDEVQSDYFPVTEVQDFLEDGMNDIFMSMVKDFQEKKVISTNLVPFLKRVTVVNPTSNIVDISNNSVDVPDFKAVVSCEAEFVINGTTYRNEATLSRTGTAFDYFESGTMRYPKYQYIDNGLLIKPEGYQCASFVLNYIVKPTPIDLEDSVTLLPYRDELIHALVTRMAALAGIPKKSVFDIQANKPEGETQYL